MNSDPIRTRRRDARLGLALAAAVLMGGVAGTSAAAPQASDRSFQAPAAAYPKAGVIRWTKVAARARPSAASRVVKVLPQFRKDFRPTYVLAVAEAKDAKRTTWLKLSLPMRPNGRFGWVRANAVEVAPVARRVVIDRSTRTLSVYDRAKLRFRTRVAIGKASAPTPLGRFYVQATFKPNERFFGAYAFETSAYSRLSDWPGGGVVGIHGTPYPELLGQAVSHGCVRVSNRAALRLKRLVRPGTPLAIVR